MKYFIFHKNGIATEFNLKLFFFCERIFLNFLIVTKFTISKKSDRDQYAVVGVVIENLRPKVGKNYNRKKIGDTKKWKNGNAQQLLEWV